MSPLQITPEALAIRREQAEQRGETARDDARAVVDSVTGEVGDIGVAFHPRDDTLFCVASEASCLCRISVETGEVTPIRKPIKDPRTGEVIKDPQTGEVTYEKGTYGGVLFHSERMPHPFPWAIAIAKNGDGKLAGVAPLRSNRTLPRRFVERCRGILLTTAAALGAETEARAGQEVPEQPGARPYPKGYAGVWRWA